MADAVLTRLRALTRELEGTREVASWGHPNFRTTSRIYSAYHPTRSGEPCIWIRLDPLAAELLRGDPRTLASTHGAAHGWIGARASGRIDWEFVAELLRDAHAAAEPSVGRAKAALSGAARRGAPRSDAQASEGGKKWRSGKSSATPRASRSRRTRTRR
jgi:predicted DNA-binding protein (MmcQ/YjbR family)